MKKIFLLLLLTSLGISISAQNPKADKLKEKLKDHPQHDTIRVNLLHELTNYSFSAIGSEETKKYAEEALTISQNMDYLKGQGFAFLLLGELARNEGNESQGEAMLFRADSIANLTGSSELKAAILKTEFKLETDPAVRDSVFREAYLLAEEADKYELQINILLELAWSMDDVLEQKALFLQADSIAQEHKDLYFRTVINNEIALTISDLSERKIQFSKVISLAEELDDQKYLAGVLNGVGYNLSMSGDREAVNYYLKSEEAAEKSGDKMILSMVRGSMGTYYLSTLSDYAKAMEYYLKQLSTAEESVDTFNIISARINLGFLYSYMGDSENALVYLLKAEETNKELGDTEIEALLQSSLGESYRLSGNYPDAIMAYQKALAVNEMLPSVWNNYINESNLADVYTRMDSLERAFYFAFKSLNVAKEEGDLAVEGWLDGILSRAYLKKNMPDSAIYYGQLGLEAAKETGTIEFMRDNTLALANAYAAIGDFENAYANHVDYISYRDVMVNEEVRNRTAVQLYTFNLDKKEAEIAVLNEQKKGQRNLLIGAVALLVLILIVAGLLLRNNRQKQKANALLENQKQEIDEKAHNVELLSDIGRKITSSLSIERIIGTAYKNVNTLMDANVFGIGIYSKETNQLEFPATYEGGEPLPLYSYEVDDENRFGSLCFARDEEIVIKNLEVEYKNHISAVPTPYEGGQTFSIIFLPLITKGKKLGVITVQSFKKNAYSDYQLFMLRNIATYAAIAIENADAYQTLNHTLSSLKSTQAQLIQSEKMAGLGELTAGIAHEIQNPLNFVNNFSELSNELLVEMLEELKKGDTEEVNAIVGDVIQNLEKINYHGKRADAIVKGMLQHARVSSGSKEPTDINALADEYLRLSYHGLRAKDKSFNALIKTDFDASVGEMNVIPQDFGRVFLNLFNNAFYAANEQLKISGKGFEPVVSVMTKRNKNSIDITVRDNGVGMPRRIMDKIFQPFFTTKPSGEGTGLGLSLSYDIVKAHGGEIKIHSKENEGTEFVISLPINN